MNKYKGWYIIAAFIAVAVIAVLCYLIFYKGETAYTEGTMVKGFLQKCRDSLV